MDLLFITDENKLHYVYIKNFEWFMCNKTKNKNKKHFHRYWLLFFSNKKVLKELKNDCLKTNGKQSIKSRRISSKFKNYYKQLAVPFKIYGDFESILKRIHSDHRSNNASYTKKYKAHIPLQLF